MRAHDRRNAPLVPIQRRFTTTGLATIEVLGCGHMQMEPRDIYGRPVTATHRRCLDCKAGERKDAVIVGQSGNATVIADEEWAHLIAGCVSTDQLAGVHSKHFSK